MDIASILAQAAEDTFAKDPLREDEQHYVQKQPQVLDSEDYNSDSEAHRNSKDRNGTEYQGQAVSKIDILKAAAQQVEKEEYRLTKEALSSAVEETEAELIRTKDITKKEAEALLLEASEEEQQYYEEVTGTTSIKQPEPVTVIPVDDEELHQQEQIDSGSEAESETSDEEENEEDDYDTNSSAQLIIACYRDRLDQVKQLLKNGGDPLARDRHGWTPLHWAASKGYEEVAEALIRHRIANDKSVKKMVNAVDNITGWTPLHVACIGGHSYVVELLLKHKAKKSKLNFLKEKPIDCIGKCKDAKYLRQLLGSKSDKKKSDKISSKNNKDSNSSEEKKNDSKFVQIAKNKTDYSDDEYKDEDFD